MRYGRKSGKRLEFSAKDSRVQPHIIFMFVMCMLCAPAESAQNKGLPAKPNIVLILTDDQGYGQTAHEGHPWLQTPHLDTLYRQSTSFTDFHVSPTCAPTRAALMTGNAPFKSGVTHTVNGRERLALDAITLPQALKKAGYTTGIFGKWHLGDSKAWLPGSRGFDEMFIHGYGGIGQGGGDVPGNTYMDPVILHNDKLVNTRGFCTDVFFEQATKWIENQKDKPFFAYLALNAPHSPFITPPEKIEKFTAEGFDKNRSGFYGMIENIDDNIGSFMKKMSDLKLLESTLIIFMSDNGVVKEGAGTGWVGHRNGKDLHAYYAGLKGSKGTVDEGGTKVPALFRWKGILRENHQITALTAHIDIFPTLMELAGVSHEKPVDGRSLVPLLIASQPQWNDRNLYYHGGRWNDAVGPDDSKFNKKLGFAVRNSRYRMVNGDELYDIIEDPGQRHDISSEQPEQLKKMLDAYSAWWDEVRPYMCNEGKDRKSETSEIHRLYKLQIKEGSIRPKSKKGRVKRGQANRFKNFCPADSLTNLETGQTTCYTLQQTACAGPALRQTAQP